MVRACCAFFLLLAAPLSDPPATRWQHFNTPYFSTNEKLLNLFYPAFDNLGGVIVGVSFQQNLSLLVHARPSLTVIFDINPGLTEILVPFFGKLWERCPTRRDFLSMLFGLNLTALQTTQLLEHPTEQLPETLGAIFEHADEPARQLRLEELRRILREEVLPGLPSPATPAMKTRALAWIDLLEEQEILSGAFFHDATAPYSLSSNAAEQHRLAGWLSTEENYRMVRAWWQAGRILTVTGDISGPAVENLSTWLRARNEKVTGLYLSNVGASVDGHFPMAWFQKMYTQLAKLPLSPGAMTLIAQGPVRLTAFAQPFTQAKWAHDLLAAVPEQYAIQLHEAPLEAGVQSGRQAVLLSLRQRLAQMDGTAKFLELVQRIEADPAAIQFLTIDQFRQWAAKTLPGIDTNSPAFPTLAVTLVETGYLRQL